MRGEGGGPLAGSEVTAGLREKSGCGGGIERTGCKAGFSATSSRDTPTSNEEVGVRVTKKQRTVNPRGAK